MNDEPYNKGGEIPTPRLSEITQPIRVLTEEQWTLIQSMAKKEEQ